MSVAIRLRAPNGQHRLDVDPNTTLRDLVNIIKDKAEVSKFMLKYSYPLKELDMSDSALSSSVQDLKLRGETVVVVPLETSSTAVAQANAQGAQTSAEVQPPPKPFKAKPMEPDETVVEWPERGGFLVLRVMPDDNSCMFTSVGGALNIQDPSTRLRREVGEYISAHPETYTKAILGDEPSRYVQRMKQKDTWGGAIELSILSDIYKIQICSVDVKTSRIDRFGENMDTRCIVVYSGIHYDRIAFAMDLGYPPDFDTTQWPTDDDQVLQKASELAQKLREQHYFTDTTDFIITCQVCGWVGEGTKGAATHIKETGHSEFVETKIS